ncbi:MAG: hypothetical protein O3A53_13670 [Acidobacteria bacterium]|nr:hypothetical protein [Acidobacteriota bacterium]
MYAAQPVVSAEGVAEIVGAIRVVLLSQTRAKRVSIDVELNAPITNPRNEGTVPSVSARLADNSQVAGSLVGINTIRFEDIDARTVEGQGVVIPGSARTPLIWAYRVHQSLP